MTSAQKNQLIRAGEVMARYLSDRKNVKREIRQVAHDFLKLKEATK